jgi:lipase chaperone LimK
MSTLALIGATALVRYGIAHMGPAETPVTPSPAATIADTLQASPRESAPPLFAAQRRDPHDVLANGSLRGTEPDGGVSVGFGGHLKPDMALRRLFDYYLVLLGETDLSSIRTLLHDDLLRRRLDPPLIDEVMASFDRYTHYQQAALALANQPGLSMEQQLAQVTALRRQMLGDETAEAFYGDEQRRQQQSLQRLAIQSDTSLSPAEKARRLQALDAALPAAEQEAQAQVSLGTTVQEQTEAFDAAQTDADTRHAERAQLFGDAAADRLQQLDQSRAQWQARLDAYTQQSQAIQADSTLTSAQQQAALQQLLTSSFHGGEQVQVQAMQSSGLLGKSN